MMPMLSMLTGRRQACVPICRVKMPYMGATLGERIRGARDAKKLSQQQLGDAVGVSRAAVSQWESSETKGLRPENLVAVADVLGVSIKWLVTGKGPKQPGDMEISKEAADFGKAWEQLPPDRRAALRAALHAFEEQEKDVIKGQN